MNDMDNQENIRDNLKDLENLYKRYFEKFLLSKINLPKYNDLIDQSDLGYGKVEIAVSLKSNLNEYLNLNHFYILNNFYVEKLTEEEKNILLSNDENAILSLVQNTYKRVLTYTREGVSNRFKINYTYSTSLDYFSFNDELVIAIYYGTNKYKYSTQEEYLDNYSKKKKFVEEITFKLTEEFKNNLGIEVKFIVEKI